MRAAIVVWSLLVVGPMSLSAQREPEPTVAAAEDTSGKVNPRPVSVGTLVFGGMSGMITGVFTGGFIGSQIDNDSGLDDADGAVIGGLIGTTLLVPTAVHLANNSRGNLNRSLLISTLVGGALLGLGVAADSEEIILALPFVQLITSITIERANEHRASQ